MAITSTQNIYNNSLEHILDELKYLDLILLNNVKKFRTTPNSNLKQNSLAGLYISDEEIDIILNDNQEEFQEQSKTIDTNIEQIQKEISKKISFSLKKDLYLTLPYLSQLFNLSPREEFFIMICLAPELDKKYEKIYAYLNDDVTKKKPTIDLLLSLTCNSTQEKIVARQFLSKQSKLLQNKILVLNDDENTKPFSSNSIKLDQRIVNFLLENNQSDSDIESFTKILFPQNQFLILSEKQKNLGTFIQNQAQKDPNQKFLINFFGPKGCGKKATASYTCSHFDIPLLTVDLSEIISRKLDFNNYIKLVLRESRLSSAAIYLDNFDAVLDNEDSTLQKTILKYITQSGSLVFVGTTKSWNPEGIPNEFLFINMDIPRPTYETRKKLWNEIIPNNSISNESLNLIASNFSLTFTQIHDAVSYARNLALTKNSDIQEITLENLYDACKAVSNQNLSKLAKKITPHYTWEDIVLPEKTKNVLQDICNHVKNKELIYHDWGFEKKFSLGKGVIALFKGESGTGKTMSAEVLANELNLDIYKIDLSSIVSKYIGETEKNLNKIFTEAQTSNAILFFDEADALFGKRSEVKDAHDRYANVETNYLLQKIEEYDGIVILATNFQKNIDEAFTRRMHFIVDFPFPDAKHRLIIWKNAFPSQVPLEKNLDLKFLSDKMRLSGGNIKNIAINSAFFAAEDSKIISMKDLIKAIHQEYQKLNKPISKSEFGKYSHLLEE